KDIPPYGFVVDYLTFGGIYRDVWLRYVEPVHISDVFVRTYDVLNENIRAEVDVYIRSQSDVPISGQLGLVINEGVISPNGSVKTVTQAQVEVHIAPQQITKVTVTLRDLKNVELWTLDKP